MARVVPSQIIALIDQTLTEPPSTRVSVNHGTVASLKGITRLIDELPTEFLTISGMDYTDLVCGVEGIRNSVDFWQRKGVAEISITPIRGQNILMVLRNALEKCPDQSPLPETAELAFITDLVLRDSIRLDMSTAASALHNGQWKAATVLAGAASEALLLWAVKNNPGLSTLTHKPPNSPEKWQLADYIKVARDLRLIEENTEEQATLAKSFRNLIHPGRAQRLKEVCDRATALAALAAVEFIVRDLSRTAHAMGAL